MAGKCNPTYRHDPISARHSPMGYSRWPDHMPPRRRQPLHPWLLVPTGGHAGKPTYIHVHVRLTGNGWVCPLSCYASLPAFFSTLLHSKKLAGAIIRTARFQILRMLRHLPLKSCFFAFRSCTLLWSFFRWAFLWHSRAMLASASFLAKYPSRCDHQIDTAVPSSDILQ